MKKVLLIGDSIRQGYDRYVKASLESEAEVFYPEENCRFSVYVLRDLVTWKSRFKLGDDLDCIHWNAGHWDNARWYDGKNLVPIEYYADYIDRVCAEIRRLWPKAKMIFATSTPVIEPPAGAVLGRFNGDVERYNAVAVETVLRYGGIINDLHALMSGLPEEYHSDVTHYYTKDAARVMTEQVVSCIEDAIGVKGRALDYDALFEEKKDFI